MQPSVVHFEQAVIFLSSFLPPGLFFGDWLANATRFFQENPVAFRHRVGKSLEVEGGSKDFPEAVPRFAAPDSVAPRLPRSTGRPTRVGYSAVRQFWLQSCGDINPGGMSSTSGVAFTMHSVTRQALCGASNKAPAGKGPARSLHVPPGGMPGVYRSGRH